jgi:hypothetical protein
MSSRAADLIVASTAPAARAGGAGALEGADRRAVPWWQVAIALAAVAAAAVVMSVTWRADFLKYPHVLAVQKADFILGPVFVGLYWMRVRPASRFGPLLIAYGFVAAGYIMQSFSNSLLFPSGLVWEFPIYSGPSS